MPAELSVYQQKSGYPGSENRQACREGRDGLQRRVGDGVVLV
jgi:hypothetical protein